MKIAFVQGNQVVEVKEMSEEQLLQVSQSYQAVVDITGFDPEPKIGWLLVGNKLVSLDPATPSMKITKLALRQRFTISELTAIYAAMNTTPIVKILMDNLMVANFVDLQRADTAGGINVLVAYGLITSERAVQILTTVPSAMEKYIE